MERKFRLLALVGGGRRAKEFLELLDKKACFGCVLGVADPDQSAPGLQFARERGLLATPEYRDLYPLFGLEVLVEVTGSDAVLEQVLRTRPAHVTVIDHTRARLVTESLAGLADPIWAEELLRRPEAADYREIFEAANDAVFVLDAETGHVLDANRKVTEMFGYNRYEAVRLDLDALSAGEFPYTGERALPGVKRAAAGQSVLAEWRARDRAGRPIWVEASMRGFMLGGQVRVLAVLRDVSQRKRAEEELQQANAELQRLSRLKDEFLSMASHELKTPVTSIRILSELAARRPAEINPSHMAAIARQSDQLARLVNDLLDVSRLDLGRVPVEVRPVDLTELLRDLCERLRPVYERHRLVCRLLQAPATVAGDRARLEQVFANLLDNAAKYSPTGGRIELGMSRRDDLVVVEVADEGIGIAPEDLPHIFERFYKPVAQQAVFPGLGVGLYISKRVVERHGGRIWAETEPGKGSTFFVELPLAQEVH